MNQDQMRGLWWRFRGRAKLGMGELVDDESLRAEGSLERLTGLLQQRFGDVRQAFRRGINRLRY